MKNLSRVQRGKYDTIVNIIAMNVIETFIISMCHYIYNCQVLFSFIKDSQDGFIRIMNIDPSKLGFLY